MTTTGFPINLLSDIAQNFAYQLALSLRVPIQLPAVSVLSIGSAAIGRGLEVQSTPDEVMRGNLYFLGAAKSGSGKTRTIKAAAHPLIEHQKSQIGFWEYQTRPGLLAERKMLEADIKKLQGQLTRKSVVVDRATLRAELTDKLRRLGEIVEELRGPQFIVEDCTVEALAPTLAANNEEIFSLSGDAGKVILNLEGRYNKEGAIDDNFYLKSFSGDHHIVNRNTHAPIILYYPTMSLLWLTQPDLLYQLFQNIRLLVGGFLARCLSFDSQIEPQEIPPNPRTIDAQVKAEYHDRIKELMNTYLRLQKPLRIPDSTEALEEIRLFHNSLVAPRCGELADINSIAARWHELALRVAIVLHVFIYGKESHHHPIAGQTASDAVGVIEWFKEEELRLLEPARGKQKEDRLNHLMRVILQRYNGIASVRDLRHSHGFEYPELEDLAKIFPTRIVIETVKNSQGGRPSEVVRVL
jgi:hypothetical protein